jgi:hypothetical protein
MNDRRSDAALLAGPLLGMVVAIVAMLVLVFA